MRTCQQKPPRVPSTDGELLMRFRRHRDGDAFAEIVQKHGPLVWSVCRQILGSHHDAEDAFQATFLILAQRRRSTHRISSLSGWLCKVAYRTAVRARHQQRRHEETQPIKEPQAAADDVLASISRQELQRVLHDELARVPEQYQAPLVLCYLQGKSRTEAAEELDCTDASVKARLARGRTILRSRLLRRGFALSAAVAATSSAVAEAAYQLPPALIQSTVEGCVGAVSLGECAAHVSTNAQSLAREGVRMMIVSNAFKIATVGLSAAALCVVAFVAFQRAGAFGSALTSDHLQVTAAGASELVPADAESYALVFQTGTSGQHDESTPQSADEVPGANSEGSTKQDGSARSSPAGEPLHALNQEKASQAPPSTQPSEKSNVGPVHVEVPEDGIFVFRGRKEDVERVIRTIESGSRKVGKTSPQNESEKKGPARANFLEKRAEVLRLKAQAKELEAQAAQASEQERNELLQQAHALEANADATMLRAEADRAAEEAALVRREAMAYQSGNPMTISPGDVVQIVASGTLPDAPIGGAFQVEPTGTVALGPWYGRVRVTGMTLEVAEKAIENHLKQRGDLISPQVQVTHYGSAQSANLDFGEK